MKFYNRAKFCLPKKLLFLISIIGIGLFGFLFLFEQETIDLIRLAEKKPVEKEVIPFKPAFLGWEEATLNASWVERDAQSAVVFDNKIWVMGGVLSGPGDYPQRVHKQDVWTSEDGKNWDLITQNAEWGPRRSLVSVVFQNKIWVLGGWEKNNRSYKNDVWHSKDGKNWTLATSSAGWSPRLGHTAVVFNNKIWVMGGRDLNWEFKNDVWYSKDGKNWTEVTPRAAWSRRYDHTLTTFNNKMWLIGGVTYGASGWMPGKKDIWTSEDGKSWELITNKAPWKGRHGHSTLVYQDKIWIIGGGDGVRSLLNDVWYSEDGVDWRKTLKDAAWKGREDHSAFVFKEKIWVMAGMTMKKRGQEVRENDVWYSIEIEPPLSLLISQYQTPGQAESVFVSGNFAYLADGFSGIQIFDVSQPENPKLIGSYDTLGYSEDIFVLKNLAFIADKDGGFLILNVSDPKNPKEISRYKPISAEGVFVSGKHAFLAYSWWGLKIFDVSNPDFSNLIFKKDLPEEAETVFVSRNYLFVAKGKDGGFQIFDISNPKHTRLISTYKVPGYSEGVFVQSNYLFLATGKTGLHIFDISNPTQPILVSNIKTPGSAEHVFISGKYAFLAAGRAGLQIIDISNPKNPKLVDNLELPGFTERVFISGNYVYLASKGAGLQIVKIFDNN